MIQNHIMMHTNIMLLFYIMIKITYHDIEIQIMMQCDIMMNIAS